jgi:hypothetical protein
MYSPTFDPELPALCNPDYFIPLPLTLVPHERDAFLKNAYPELKENIVKRKVGLSNLGTANNWFIETTKQTNEFLAPLGVKSTIITVFGSVENDTSWNIHVDGTTWNGQVAASEARLSYYELTEAPGQIRWWDHLETEVDYGENKSFADKVKQLHKFSIRAKVALPLRNKTMSWDQIPAPAFTSTTSSPSALLRTNIPHHVIQGPGIRLTIGCQLTFNDFNPCGVWQHIRNNIHKLNLPNVQ